MVGIGVSMVFIPTMKILSQWFRVSEFAFMSGILFTMGGIGVYVATAPLAVFSAWVGWRASFVIIGLATLAIAILVWLIVRNRPEDMGWPSLAEIDHLGPGFAAPPKQIPLWDGVRRVVSEPRFWVVAAWFTCTASIAFSFGALWAGPFLKHVYGMSQSQVGNVLSMIALGLILGSPFMSFLSDKVFKSRKKVITLSSALLVAELILLNLAPDRLPVFSLYILLFLFCVFASAVVVVGFATTKELFPVEIAGTSVGTANLFPFLGGAILQIVLGRVLDAYTKTPDGAYPLEAYSALLLILLAVGVAGLVCTFFIKETFPAGAR
jgi:sugar phosphate permease